MWYRDEPVSLALKEVELLSALTEHPGEVVGKDDLMEKLWADSFVDESNLARHIYILRKTLKELGADGELIQTVPRRGYRFALPVKVLEPGTLVIKKHTSTEATIDIEELSDAPDRSALVVLADGLSRVSRLPALAALAVVLVAASGLMFYGLRDAAGSGRELNISSVAVLPFSVVGGESGDRHEGLGMADMLITRLSNLKEIKVRPTSAVIPFANVDAAAAGRELQTDTVFEGTIYRSADKIRVTARLVSVSDNSTIWAGDFERPTSEEMTLQNEVARSVAKALALNLSRDSETTLAKQYTENLDAYRLYVQARYEWNRRDYEGGTRAGKLFRDAIERDPGFALAWSGLADGLSIANGSAAEAYYAIQKALELDPHLAEAHASKGLYLMFQSWRGANGPQWDAAEASFRRSIELNPNYTPARQWLATLLSIKGRPREAQDELRRALEIDPASHNLWSDLAEAHYFAREYTEAEKCAFRSLEIYPEFVLAYGNLRNIYRQTGEYEKSVEYEFKFERAYGSLSTATEESRRQSESESDRMRRVFAEGGIRAFLQRRVVASSSGDASSLYGHAKTYAFLGEREKALDALERAFELRAFMFVFFNAEPAFDDLRPEPRFQELLRKMSL
ncbi:MAG: winged helix-turn-helix domain-containing tetratricopeptide repeat protein [Pyrinomonadaceae bacterium]